jgi:hypothetical protein
VVRMNSYTHDSSRVDRSAATACNGAYTASRACRRARMTSVHDAHTATCVIVLTSRVFVVIVLFL